MLLFLVGCCLDSPLSCHHHRHLNHIPSICGWVLIALLGFLLIVDFLIAYFDALIGDILDNFRYNSVCYFDRCKCVGVCIDSCLGYLHFCESLEYPYLVDAIMI